jgi:CheY-like chemotaxis protein
MPDALVVDDAAQVARFAAATLRLSGWTTRVASSGHHGLALVAERVPDVVVLDLQLPELSGLEALDHLRQAPATRHVPVLVWSGQEEAAGDAALQRGAAGFLRKPVAAGALLATVERLVTAAAGATDEPLPPLGLQALAHC